MVWSNNYSSIGLAIMRSSVALTRPNRYHISTPNAKAVPSSYTFVTFSFCTCAPKIFSAISHNSMQDISPNFDDLEVEG